MSTNPRITLMIERLNAAFQPTHLEVIDESEQHRGHAGYGQGGRHFAIIIASPHLSALPRVEAHRRIYAVFSDLIPQDIHALRIIVQTHAPVPPLT